MLRQNTYRKGVLWMLLFNGIAKGISFILGIILAKNFLPQETDIYLYVWGIINVVMMIVSSVNLMVVGPAYILLSETDTSDKAAKLCSALMNIYMLPLVLFSIVTLALPFFTYGALSGFTHDQLFPYGGMLRFSGIWMLLVVLNLFLGNLFMSRKFFVVYILGQVIAAVITLAVILLFKNKIGINSFFIGQLAGNITCLLFYLFFISSKLQIKLKPFYFYIPPKIIREVGAVLIISVPTMVINFLLVYYLSHYEIGQLSAYNYGSALSNLPDVIFLSQLVSVFGVRFAEIMARRENDALFDTFRFYGNHLFFFMSGVAIIISLASPAIIQTIYGKEDLGKPIFDSAVLSLSLLAASLPFKALDVMNNRLFASIQALSSLVKYTLPVKIFNIGLMLVMERIYGFNGLLVHQILMPIVMVLVQIYLLGKFFPLNKIHNYYAQVLLLLVCGLAVYAGIQFLSGSLLEAMNPYMEIVVVCIVVVIMGLIIEKIFRLTSFHNLILTKGLALFKKRLGS